MYIKKQYKAFSLGETMLALVLVMTFVVLSSSIFTQKATKSLAISHGRFECYKDADDILHERIYDDNGLLSSNRDDIADCTFTPPGDADMYSIEVIGGGGAGGDAAFTKKADGSQFANGSTSITCGKTLTNPISSYDASDTKFNTYIFGASSYVPYVCGQGGCGGSTLGGYCCKSSPIKYKTGDQISCINPTSSPPTGQAAQLSVQNKTLRAQGCTSPPTCGGTLPGVSTTSYTFTEGIASQGNSGRVYLEYYKNGSEDVFNTSIPLAYRASVSAHDVFAGKGGVAGDYKARTVDKNVFSGPITIQKNSIGSGGKWNSSAGSTLFPIIVQPQLMAMGGQSVGQISTAVELKSGPDALPIVNGGRGAIIKDILTEKEIKDPAFYGEGGVGNNNGNTSSNYEGGKGSALTFGGGGGGGGVVFLKNTNVGLCLWKDNIKKLNECNTISPGTITAGRGGNGGGGAIIIRW